MASPDPTFLELLEPIVFVEDQATADEFFETLVREYRRIHRLSARRQIIKAVTITIGHHLQHLPAADRDRLAPLFGIPTAEDIKAAFSPEEAYEAGAMAGEFIKQRGASRPVDASEQCARLDAELAALDALVGDVEASPPMLEAADLGMSNGEVLRRNASGLSWGSIDLADADAVTRLLPLSNLAGLTILGRSAPPDRTIQIIKTRKV